MDEKRVKVSTSGSVESKYQVTGSGEEQYIVSRHAVFEKEPLTKDEFDSILRQASSRVSEPREKPKSR